MVSPNKISNKVTHLVQRFHGLEARGYTSVIVEIVMICLAFILVLNRFCVRFHIGQKPGLDDYVILASLAFCIAMNAVNIAAIHYGYGKYTWEVSKDDMCIALKLFYCLQILYKCTINLTKISIVLLYRRIFETTKFRFPYICDCIIGVVAAYALVSIIVTLFECAPMARVWDRSIPGACINFTAFWYMNAAWNISTDLLIFLLPMPLIHTLSLPTRSKIGLTAVFAMGLFVCATSILRMKSLDVSSKSPDPSHGTLISTMWTTIEANTGIICACLPMLRIPLAQILEYLSSWYRQLLSVKVKESSTTMRVRNSPKDNTKRDKPFTGWIKGNRTNK
ncbi:hypothetical protein LOZ53_006315 [Ophidiomyces ophidiicola]|nr:hypothetical protein LOZ54_006029 [Ophidiomyces ophidiicola]KAI1980297.1 hypothetical protein LOZ55_001447 [Ophidiomyces ophidiicola]KAI1982158.1 hypothetical protein LOZ53_006315 [Ophidiomyces ophidiicola]KAI1987890.1 hypothetical protein LOZ51_005654 [Ophidiomyces ophidiicola]